MKKLILAGIATLSFLGNIQTNHNTQTLSYQWFSSALANEDEDAGGREHIEIRGERIKGDDPITPGGGGTGNGSGSGNGNGAGPGGSGDVDAEVRCHNTRLSAQSGLDECELKVKDGQAKAHADVCLERGTFTGTVNITIVGTIIQGLLGANLISDNYTKCFNQLTLNANALLAKCSSAASKAIEKACKK